MRISSEAENEEALEMLAQNNPQIGKAEGMAEGAKAIALRLLDMKMPIDDIAGATGLTREEIERLAT